MAYFRKLKLDSNFEEWLDSRILKLKAEGIIESDPEEQEGEEGGGEETAEQRIRLRAAPVSNYIGETQVEEFDDYGEYIWGEEIEFMQPEIPERPIGGDADGHSLTTVVSGENMSAATAVGDGAEDDFRHISTKVGGDYYQFVWEEDEEADVFDQEAYRLGHTPRGSEGADYAPTGRAGEPRNSGRGRPRTASSDGEVYTAVGDGIPPRQRIRPSGLVLGVGRQDVEVAYTQMGRPGSGGASPRLYEQQWQFSIGDDDDDVDAPEPADPPLKRDRPDGRSDSRGHNDVPMLEFRQGATKGRHGRGLTGKEAAALPRSKVPSSVGDQPNGEVPSTHLNKDRILLPMDNMEMTMTTDDDEDILDEDDFDARSELAPDTQNIVTVDQATLVQQWRSKSKRTRWAILIAIGSGVLLLFSLVTFLIVHILSTTWKP